VLAITDPVALPVGELAAEPAVEAVVGAKPAIEEVAEAFVQAVSEPVAE